MVGHLRRPTPGLGVVVPAREHETATGLQDPMQLDERGRLVRREEQRVDAHDGVGEAVRQARRLELPAPENSGTASNARPVAASPSAVWVSATEKISAYRSSLTRRA